MVNGNDLLEHTEKCENCIELEDMNFKVIKTLNLLGELKNFSSKLEIKGIFEGLNAIAEQIKAEQLECFNDMSGIKYDLLNEK